MSYTYLITGATSDVGRALIGRLLTGAPDALVLAQGCGDLTSWPPCASGFPDKSVPLMWICPTVPK